MRKFSFIIIIFICAALLLASCSLSASEDERDFEFNESAAVPLSDVKIALLYHGEVSLLKDDAKRAVDALGMRGDQFVTFDTQTEDGGTDDSLLTLLPALGVNLVIADRNVPDPLIESLAKALEKTYFAAYGTSVEKSNVISFSDNFLEYTYILGVYAASTASSDAIGVLTDDAENVASHVTANAFAAGARIVNSNIKLIVSADAKAFADNKCESVFVSPQISYTSGSLSERVLGFNVTGQRSVSLDSDHSVFIKSVIDSVTDGTFAGGSVALGIKYDLCGKSFDKLTDDGSLLSILNGVKSYFVNGMPVFSNNSLMINGDEIISITEPVVDSLGNTVIDESGNYYCYDGDELEKCASYDALINEKMNYFYNSVIVK